MKGRPVLAADTMVGIVLGSGLAEYFVCVEENANAVTYETKRKGSPHPQVCTWTMEDARAAGLIGGDNWKKYPRAMLKARCKAMLARDAYPDVLAGCYEPDEAREFTDRGPMTPPPPREREQVEDAEVVDPPEPEVLQDIDAADSLGALEALLPRLTKLDDATKTKARARYGTKKKALQAAAQEGAA